MDVKLGPSSASSPLLFIYEITGIGGFALSVKRFRYPIHPGVLYPPAALRPDTGPLHQPGPRCTEPALNKHRSLQTPPEAQGQRRGPAGKGDATSRGLHLAPPPPPLPSSECGGSWQWLSQGLGPRIQWFQLRSWPTGNIHVDFFLRVYFTYVLFFPITKRQFTTGG